MYIHVTENPIVNAFANISIVQYLNMRSPCWNRLLLFLGALTVKVDHVLIGEYQYRASLIDQ